MHALDQFPTPMATVDLDIVEKNIIKTASGLREYGIAYRPHVKTHKSVELARLQQSAGLISGITCARIAEAEVFAQYGFDDILLTNAVIGQVNAMRLATLAGKARIICFVNSLPCAESILMAGELAGKPIEVLIELDGGIGRGGLTPDEGVLDFARALRGLKGLTVAGVAVYAGQIYSAKDEAEMIAIAKSEAEITQRIAAMLRADGFDIRILSGGSTVSVKFPQALAGLTEARAGTCVFHDVMQLSLGLVTVDECALRIETTVLSTPAPGRAIIDAGSKALTYDQAPRHKGLGYVVEYPDILIEKANEEHGFLSFDPSIKLSIGQRIHIIPNHVCPVVNLNDKLFAVRGGKFAHVIDVQARGKSF